MKLNLKVLMDSLNAKPGQVVSNPFARAFKPLKEEEISIEEYSKIKEEEDHEVSMAQNQLDTIIKMATELKAKMGEDEKEIPAWIQDHISKAENYISQASSNYHEYGNSNESVNEAADGKKRFMFDFYNDSNQRNTERETNYITDSLESAISQAEHMCKVTGYKYVEIYYRDLFLGSLRKENGYKFIQGRGYTKYKSTYESIKEARLTDIVRSIVETPVIGKIVSKHRVEEAKKIKYHKTITKDQFAKTQKDSKIIINGVHYLMFYDDKIGTFLAPVKIEG